MENCCVIVASLIVMRYILGWPYQSKCKSERIKVKSWVVHVHTPFGFCFIYYRLKKTRSICNKLDLNAFKAVLRECNEEKYCFKIKIFKSLEIIRTARPIFELLQMKVTWELGNLQSLRVRTREGVGSDCCNSSLWLVQSSSERLLFSTFVR